MKEATVARDGIELRAGRRAALLKRRAVAMIGFGLIAKVNREWCCFEVPKGKENVQRRVSNVRLQCPYASLMPVVTESSQILSLSFVLSSTSSRISISPTNLVL